MKTSLAIKRITLREIDRLTDGLKVGESRVVEMAHTILGLTGKLVVSILCGEGQENAELTYEEIDGTPVKKELGKFIEDLWTEIMIRTTEDPLLILFPVAQEYPLTTRYQAFLNNARMLRGYIRLLINSRLEKRAEAINKTDPELFDLLITDELY